MKHNNWNGFIGGSWQDEINVRDFIQQNYKPYEGDSSFLAPATERTNKLMDKLNHLFELEQFFGRTYADSPDIDGRVWIATEEPIREGQFVTVTIDGCEHCLKTALEELEDLGFSPEAQA